MADGKDYIVYSAEKGNVNISEEVIAAIAANAALEIDGVEELYSTLSKDIAELLGKKNVSRGVKITVEDDVISADIGILVRLGCAVNAVGEAVQKAVFSAIESSTGFKVANVNVHVGGVVLDKKQ